MSKPNSNVTALTKIEGPQTSLRWPTKNLMKKD